MTEAANKLRDQMLKDFEENLNSTVNPNPWVEKFTPDSIVLSVIDRFIERAKMGKKKYNTDLDRNDLTLSDFLEHAQQEHMDAILYLEKAKKIINEQKEESTNKIS